MLGEEPWKEMGQLMRDVSEGPQYPAVYVTYLQAKQFAQAMNRIDPTAEYRLPFEAELEYAARAGTVTEYYWGDHVDPRYAFYWKNSKKPGEYSRKVTSCPVPAMEKKVSEYCANAFGLMHVLGNVWQWTADAYMNAHAKSLKDGHRAVKGYSDSPRVIRGGSWAYYDQGRRSAYRLYRSPDYSFKDLGFRLVRVPK